ncbi:hypothetical protein [Endozoicomonas sp. Mp262]|uniref:hypothetical protein n=1 Tax=Endozoicomonas sp. Mp262 TaxID=2919499 RepID=UPI0021D8500F
MINKIRSKLSTHHLPREVSASRFELPDDMEILLDDSDRNGFVDIPLGTIVINKDSGPVN